MAVSGLSGNLFELLSSQDKKVSDLFALLKAGDTLKGRVIEVIPSDNKAIINFKGYNVISQLPNNAPLSKGDAITVQVSQMGEKIFMKLIPDGLAAAGKLMPSAVSVQPAAEQVAALLSAIKVPVNEQNIYTAMKLADYQIAVTKENMNQIHTALNNYMSQKGVDASSLNSVFDKAAAQTASFRQDSIIAMMSLNLKLNQAVKTMAGIKDPQVINALKQEVSAAMINSINTVNSAAKSADDVSVNVKDGSVTLNVNNTGKELLSLFMNKAAGENLAKPAEVNNFLNAAMSSDKQPVTAKFASGAEISYNPVKLELNISFPGMNAALNTVVPSGNPELAAAAAKSLAGRFFEPSIKPETFKPAEMPLGQKVLAGAGLNLNKDIFARIMAIGNNTEQRGLQANAGREDMAPQVKSARDMASAITDFTKNLAQAASAVKNGNSQLSGEILRVSEKLNEFIKANSKVIFGNATAAEAAKFTKNAAEFVENNINSSILKDFFVKPEINSTAVNLPVTKFDVESAIESLIFLKSREMPLDNTKFTDIMNKYFSGDIKLNQNLEALNASLSRFLAAGESMRAAGYNESKSMQLAAGIKEAIAQISIKPSDRAVMDGQIKNFIEKSGITLEAQVKDIFSGKAHGFSDGQSKEALISGARQNMKSLLVGLEAELSVFERNTSAAMKNADNDTLSVIKDTVNGARESVKDTLNNLNAMQFINQKPAAYEIIYTQIPLLMDNKLFNGELQVWYRKGSLKENLEAKEPVNIMFVLNTSKLGNVKVRMTVYKNDVECTVIADNEKAKQQLTKMKNDFLKGIETINYSMRNFMIKTEEAGEQVSSPESDGYINLGNINLKA
ncbi:MAG: hypothetical protein JXR81_04355 [Candidatus Goldbacteria bacterium]|nr:hypothetical protein [Candidatus Goldiibacteriota bacterium]